jgi:hypothetical protein
MKEVLNLVKDLLKGSIALFVSPLARILASIVVNIILATPNTDDDAFAEDLAKNILSELKSR